MDTVGGSNAISTLSDTIKTTWQQNERQREGRDQHIHCRTKQSLTCNETAPVILPLEEEEKIGSTAVSLDNGIFSVVTDLTF